jgi:hypothetical protein
MDITGGQRAEEAILASGEEQWGHCNCIMRKVINFTHGHVLEELAVQEEDGFTCSTNGREAVCMQIIGRKPGSTEAA